jgi:hypothetical protein
LGFPIERGHPPVEIGGEQPTLQALDRALMERAQVGEILTPLFERDSGPHQFAGQAPGECRDAEHRRAVDEPARQEDGEWFRAGGEPAPLAQPEHDSVGQRSRQGSGHRAPTREEQSAVEPDHDIEEGEDRVLPTRKDHQRRNQCEVGGDVDRGEHTGTLDPPDEGAIDEGRHEAEHDRDVEGRPLGRIDVAADRVEDDTDGQTAQSEREPRPHKDQQQTLDPDLAPIPIVRAHVSRWCRRS